jgi:hypothetical protein
MSLQCINRTRIRGTLWLMWPVIASLNLGTAPAFGQTDKCYPGLDCPEDEPRRSPPQYGLPPSRETYRPQQVPSQPSYGVPPIETPGELQVIDLVDLFGGGGQIDQPQPQSIHSYSAHARCSRTGVVGRSAGQPTPQHALAMAIEDCIARGGIPACCEIGAHLAY